MSEEEVKVHPTHESSIPVGDLKAKTRGRQPRSREASTRDMFLRATSESVDYYKKLFQRDSIAKTYIDPDIIPPEIETLWARQYFKGMPDSSNLLELSRKGWKYATPEMFPSLAFMDDTGAIDDSAGRVINNEYYLMYREQFIHQLELDKFKEMTAIKNNVGQNIASDSNFGRDAHPFGGISSTGESLSSGYNDTYASSSLSREIMQDHLK